MVSQLGGARLLTSRLAGTLAPPARDLEADAVVCFCSYGAERMRQKLLVVVTGGLVKVITPLMLMVFVS